MKTKLLLVIALFWVLGCGVSATTTPEPTVEVGKSQKIKTGIRPTVSKDTVVVVAPAVESPLPTPEIEVILLPEAGVEPEPMLVELEVVVEPANFTIPDTTRTQELLTNRRTVADAYWCSYPEGKDYWFCGPIDGTQFYCQYFGDYHLCFNDFYDETPVQVDR